MSSSTPIRRLGLLLGAVLLLPTLLASTACSPSVDGTGVDGTGVDAPGEKSRETTGETASGPSTPAGDGDREGPSGETVESFADHLAAMSGPPYGMLERDSHGAWESVRVLYEKTGSRPLWSLDEAPPARAARLLDELAASVEHGLEPRDYRTDELKAGLKAAAEGDLSLTDRRNLDVALTSAAVLHGAHLLRGRVLPSQVQALWDDHEPAIVLPARIAAGIENDSLVDTFDSLTPPHAGYDALRKRLERYRGIVESGGWPEIPGDDTVEPGDDVPDEIVTALVERLATEGFVGPASEAPRGEDPGTRRYLPGLAEAVERFQASRTLDVDGVLGPETRAALNRPATEIVQTIRMSLDRWRWMPHRFGSLAVIVNIPTYDLFLYRNEKVVERMGVVVGKAGWPTTIIRDEIERVVFNPYWNVPRSIVEDEIVPKLREDPDHLAREGLEVVRGWGDGEIVPRNEVSPRDLLDPDSELRLRQPPGPRNALGRVKLVFPNRDNIYLHDTPAGHLFGETDRSFSHGCVRVEHPVGLATALLQDRNGWSGREVRAAIRRGENRQVDLEETVPVFITYLTAVPAPEDGMLLGRDVYDLDDKHQALWDES